MPLSAAEKNNIIILLSIPLNQQATGDQVKLILFLSFTLAVTFAPLGNALDSPNRMGITYIYIKLHPNFF